MRVSACLADYRVRPPNSKLFRVAVTSRGWIAEIRASSASRRTSVDLARNPTMSGNRKGGSVHFLLRLVVALRITPGEAHAAITLIP